MQTGTDVLRDTDWTRTFHAYGSGADAPEHLAPLLTGDPGERRRALGYLYGAILHQGTVYSATVPAALFVAGILGSPALDAPAVEGGGTTPFRHTLLRFLADAAEAAEDALHHAVPEAQAPPEPSPADLDRVYAALGSDDEDEALHVWEEPVMEALMNRVGPDMRAAAPALYEAVHPLLTHADPGTRMRAVEAAAAVARLGGFGPDLSGAADMAECRDEGAVIVLALGRVGADTTEFLTHADPAIRVCAALAPAQAANPAATEELAAALADPAGADAWFGSRPSYFPDRVRFTLARVLAERSAPADAERLLPVLRAVAPLSSTGAGAADVGQLLRVAFPSAADAGADLTGVQRAYLAVLLDNDALWESGVPDFRFHLKGLGLPQDRGGISALAGV
ncbi:hypothetical protein Q8791_27380 [Nocardiopsis sp. CT-R113]|uniref:HEAT repeat domain-containing protein n=1 Tax=Nocardiopsis codii TaxID=3065942 RepID=A0ABU7KG94_9ACTN|nr:hypothetical protein [Nocardiopsis sp. CT-R113]MEE2040949.1 hypothetical protein [Nocardiopsis sp. CT-R113]